MSKPYSIVILGGGSSGWITAAWLTKQFGSHPDVKISLVESQATGIIGVGEATIPPLLPFLRMLEVSEEAFMRATSATFKNGILYKDWAWTSRESGSRHTYFHPFDGFDMLSFNPGAWWLAHRAGQPGADYARDICAQSTLAIEGLAPRTRETPAYQGDLGYAYHFDAEKFAEFLKAWCVQRGLVHEVADVSAVMKNPEGQIAALKTGTGEQLEADLFVDCSGFKGLLINDALGTPFQSFGKELFCDQAVAIRVPEPDGPPLRPYTTTTAWSSGWLWEIDLLARRGIGYVHSSRHTTFEEAEAALRAHLGPAADQLPVRRLKMRVGRSTRFWASNVVAIGLSGGFIEPLESTGIYLVEYGARLLAKALTAVVPATLMSRTEGRASKSINRSAVRLDDLLARLQRQYNDTLVARYDEIKDFVKLHYFLSRRSDSAFWRENRDPASVSDQLRSLLQLWMYRPPDSTDFPDRSALFNHANWLYILLGMGWRPRLIDRANGFASRETGQTLLRRTADDLRRGRERLSSQAAYFAQVKA